MTWKNFPIVICFELISTMGNIIQFILNKWWQFEKLCHTINQSIERSVSQSINQSINTSINQSINQAIYQSINQSISRLRILYFTSSNIDCPSAFQCNFPRLKCKYCTRIINALHERNRKVIHGCYKINTRSSYRRQRISVIAIRRCKQVQQNIPRKGTLVTHQNSAARL